MGLVSGSLATACSVEAFSRNLEASFRHWVAVTRLKKPDTCDTTNVQAYTVASGIIVDKQQLLLVQNQRKNGSLDWSTPGGVVDPGEEVLEALQREVIEETAVVVEGWSQMLYSVDVDFVGREMTLHAQIFRAHSFSGALVVDDPDNVVVAGRWVSPDQAHGLLDTSPPWVAEPLRHAVDNLFGAASQPAGTTTPNEWHYRVTGTGRDFKAELVHFEG